jgi:predicted polyphosphate/ATP-dependent NAD kinase
MPRLGLIVNPIAGMGGAVGLKGTDGASALQEARRRGATPRSPDRAIATLAAARDSLAGVEIVTCAGRMGANEVGACGLPAVVVGGPASETTTSEDTRSGARALREAGVDLLLFAGGDGTARDILSAVASELPALGIPTGVKMHSGVFATSPRAAGTLAARYLGGEVTVLRESEVMDIDEEAYRSGRLSARLFGYLKVPYDDRSVQKPKSRSAPEAGALHSVAQAAMRAMAPDSIYIVGPGTTTRAVMEALGLEGSLLGVDVVQDGALLATDANEQELLRLVEGRPARILVTPIGGQGYIFGRGNHQISGRVIRDVGTDNIMVIAVPSKLFDLRGAPLLVDTDDEEINRRLQGYARVLIGVGQELVYPVAI